MASPTIQFKRGQSANVGLASFRAGEPGFTTDKYDFYIGVDGSHINQKFFGSSRYWEREDGSNSAQLKLVDKNGSNSINFQAPNTLSGIGTWVLPDYNAGAANEFLKISSKSGNQITLDWATVVTTLDIAADNGSNTVGTGSTISFAGTTNEIETTIVDNQVKIGLSTNIAVSGNIIVDGTVDGRDVAEDGESVDNLVSLSGVSKDSTDLGQFNGSTIHDTRTIKEALQDLETSLESVSGGGSSATSVSIGTTDSNSTYYVTFVDSDNNTKIQENIYTNSGIAFNPSTNVLTVDSFDGNLTGFSELTAPYSSTTKNYSVTVGGKSDHRYSGGSGSAYYVDGVESPALHLTPGRTYRFNLSSGDMSNHPFRFYLEAEKITVYNTDVTITSTYAEITISDVTPAVLYYQCSAHALMGNSIITHSGKATSVVENSVLLGTDTIGNYVSSVSGTTNEVEVSGGGSENSSIVVGLSDDVTITNSLTTPTVKTGSLHSNNGTPSLTISNDTGSIETLSNLTVGGNLFVNGSTTQVNTSQTTIEDQLLELGMVDGAAPTSDLNKDIGVIFNYYTNSAKKAAIYWDNSTNRIVVAAEVTETSGVINSPTSFADFEIKSLILSDSVGTGESVITVNGTDRVLENIVVDAGTF